MVPFSRCSVPGWSIQEMTDPDFWFTSSDQLGPWDWKIEALHDGLVYGRFIDRSSCFATEEMYRHLMNWRRSRPYYKMAEGGRYKAVTINDRLHKYIAPAILAAIRENGSLESSALRGVVERDVPVNVRKKVGGYIGKHLLPKVDKQATDAVMGYLDMGTWTLVGDITRVYRGPNCEYKGWQRNTLSTPEALLDVIQKPSENPFWVKFIDDSTDQHETAKIDCSPEESRLFIIEKIRQFFPDATAAIEKLIDG